MWANFTGSELNYLNVSFIFNKPKESSLLRTHILPIYKVSSFSATGKWTSIHFTAASSFRNKAPTNSPILLKVANYFSLSFMVLYCCYSIKFTTSLNKNKSKLFQVKFNIPGAVKRKDE